MQGVKKRTRQNLAARSTDDFCYQKAEHIVGRGTGLTINQQDASE